MSEKYWECPECKGTLSTTDLENEKSKIANGEKDKANCKHCGFEFKEGTQFKEKKSEESKKPVESSGEGIPLPNRTSIAYECNSCKGTIEEANFFSLEKSKEGLKCPYCGNFSHTYNKLTFVEDNKPTNPNTPKKSSWTAEPLEYEKCPNCQQPMKRGFCKECLKKDKNNNCLFCGKKVEEDEFDQNHRNCMEKQTQKSSFGLKMAETKNNPKLLMAFGGGIAFMVIGIVGIIISSTKLSKLGKEKIKII